jgi:diguanylate cyclase
MLAASMPPVPKIEPSHTPSITSRPWASGFWRARTWLDWVLTDDPQQRTYIIRYFVGAANCAGALAALALAIRAGLTVNHPDVVPWFTLAGILVELIFFVVLRSGFNKRFEDPSLTAYEINAAISFIAVGYWLAPLRGEAYPLVLLIIVLMFAMFATTPKQLGRCCLWALVAMTVSFMAVILEGNDPLGTVMHAFHAALIMVVLPTVYVLASHLARIRQRLRERKDELKAALARIEALATIDALTGLLNRREMRNVLDLQEKVAARRGQGFCICMIDIDFFKRVNDVHGHHMGDEVLRVFAATARSALRETDVISRWGGEEFLVLMLDTDITLARTAVERLRVAMGQVSVPAASGQRLKVTFSAGLARYRVGESVDGVIERADRALYRAKADGRDRTALEQAEAVDERRA